MTEKFQPPQEDSNLLAGRIGGVIEDFGKAGAAIFELLKAALVREREQGNRPDVASRRHKPAEFDFLNLDGDS